LRRRHIRARRPQSHSDPSRAATRRPLARATSCRVSAGRMRRAVANAAWASWSRPVCSKAAASRMRLKCSLGSRSALVRASCSAAMAALDRARKPERPTRLGRSDPGNPGAPVGNTLLSLSGCEGAMECDPGSPWSLPVAFFDQARISYRNWRGRTRIFDVYHVGSAPSDDHEDMDSKRRHRRPCRPNRKYSADRGKPLGYFGLGAIDSLTAAKGETPCPTKPTTSVN
jgi:hypothetical protein